MKLQFTVVLLFLIFYPSYPRSNGTPIKNKSSSEGTTRRSLTDKLKSIFIDPIKALLFCWGNDNSEPNIPEQVRIEDAVEMYNAKHPDASGAGEAIIVKYGHEDESIELPENFDCREKWPMCPSISHIYDQGMCGSCWAVSSVAAFTDRMCIKSGGTITSHRSSQGMISCCKQCGDGCGSGAYDLFEAFLYLRNTGVVTGGDYSSNKGCQPYLSKPCAINSKARIKGTKLPDCHYSSRNTPKCESHCYNRFYKTEFVNDIMKGKQIYVLYDERAAQIEMYKNGPIILYEDLIYTDMELYKSGVYKHKSGKPLGSHTMRLIGWGVENGEKYWLIANTWNRGWGQDGFGKIIREDVSNHNVRYVLAITTD